MSILAGQKIVASDIFSKFKTDISSDLAEVKTGVSALADALTSTDAPPVYKYYVNKYIYDNASVVEVLMDNLSTFEATYDATWSAQPSAVSRHLQPAFDSTEASGRVVKHDFIGAYHLRAFIESLYGLATNLRNIEMSFADIANTELTARVAFNDFALNNNDDTAEAMAANTMYETQLTDDHYININTVGRQVVTNLTAAAADNSEVVVDPTANLAAYYNITSDTWITASDTGVAKQFNELSGVNYPNTVDPDNPESTTPWHDPELISEKLAQFYANTGSDKILSKESGVRHIVTASTVNALLAECKTILNKLKSDLVGQYVYTTSTDVGDVVNPFQGYASLGYPYSKHWFISKNSGTAGITGTTAKLSTFSVVTPLHNSDTTAPKFYTGNKALRNDEWAPSEDWVRNIPVRPGYTKDIEAPIYTTTNRYVPMPLTYQNSSAVHGDLANATYLTCMPSALYATADPTWIHLDKVNDAAAATQGNMRRVCISWPDWNENADPVSTVPTDIRHYYTFLSSYKSLIVGANAGVLTAGPYINQCVVTGYYGRGTTAHRTTLKEADSTITGNTINLALAKFNPATTSATIITDTSAMPSSLGFTITSWAVINEVNSSHGTSAYASYGIDTSSGEILLAKYNWGHATRESSLKQITAANMGAYIRHTVTSAGIPAVLENAMYKFRYRYAALYGDADLLAKKSFADITTDISAILKIGNVNPYFQGCAGGAAATTFILKRLTDGNRPYGAITPPTFKYGARLLADDGHADAVSQGYIGYEGFQFSYDVNTDSQATIASTKDTNLLSFVPLPTDMTLSTVAGLTSSTTHYISVSSTHWWNTLNKLEIYEGPNKLATLSGNTITNQAYINTGIQQTTDITALTVVATNNFSGKITQTTPFPDPEVYTIVFDAADGEGSMDNITATENVPIQLPDNMFTLSGNTFGGWIYTTDAGVTPILDASKIILNADTTAIINDTYTLSATWIEDVLPT